MKNTIKQKLDWEILEQPIFIGDSEEKSKKALVRSDDQKLLGIRSKHYHPIFNRDLESIKEKILDTNLFLFKGYEEFNNGKRILLFFKNKRNDLEICGQDVEDYLIVGNSNDTSSKLFIGMSNHMYRCQNQFSERISNFEWKHDRPFDINNLDILKMIYKYESGRKNLYLNMSELSCIKADKHLIQELAQKLLYSEKRMETTAPLHDKRYDLLIECIETEMNDLGPTLWGLFNGVTRYTSNHIQGKPGLGIVNGIGEKMNREALRSIRNKAFNN